MIRGGSRRGLAVCGLLVLAGACLKGTDSENPAIAILGIGCEPFTNDGTTQSFKVSAQGSAQGPVGTTMTPETGRGTGAADPTRTIGTLDEMVFTFWSFGAVGDDITRSAGDGNRSNISLEFTVTVNLPVTPFPVYVRFHLVPPSGAPLDAERTTTCSP